jgi:hypothetical protein
VREEPKERPHLEGEVVDVTRALIPASTAVIISR